ncbi:DUF6011 domain-containing protein [Micromonospora sp. WMMD710]|uniref:DUF6011 domain-containing protein n=1 Tax=Micromonospora sp. WMMD710 TaxID=3016085 RepID=UPI002416F48B|nr:DUF6011 domain-containing protein [Micromonospora sp. WMMD710]MDG4756304.1 DUF6011 domain-containing protein [Micromonospora sp. WMMD710]MDG4762399.1 DUF6011 domain-containing protein [Micromonospora sp. WMMD710]MDG4762447.1 DUF6011 domain-containing protein [Micromonospora sp. WMMD710]MDG4762482.1 DUF6011 domain-containing protein [Micromonospora sp. WMMD710]
MDKNCDLCGRKLRTPESRARGRGPVCDANTRPEPAVLPGLGRAGGGPAQTGPDLLADVDQVVDETEGGDR